MALGCEESVRGFECFDDFTGESLGVRGVVPGRGPTVCAPIIKQFLVICGEYITNHTIACLRSGGAGWH
jgi:hypothetical protein